jgi:predicted outer membrane repeat protein
MLLFLLLPLAALLGAASSVTPASAATITISSCDLWALDEAIENADSGDTITFECSGTMQTWTTERYKYLIDKDLTIDGNGNEVILDSSNSGAMFVMVGEITFTLKGLTFINAVGASRTSCIGCPTSDYASVVTNQTGTLNVIDSTFSNNHSTAQIGGGAIANLLGTLNVSNSTFSNNSSRAGGGAISSDGPLTVSNSTFSNNVSDLRGGAIFVSDGLGAGTATISGSTFVGNIATDIMASGDGGGVSNWGTTTIINSTFSGNSAQAGGAIQNNGSLQLIHSTLSGNDAFWWANGILNGYTTYGTIGGVGVTTFTNTILANADATFRGSKSGYNMGGNCSGSGESFINAGGNVDDDDTCVLSPATTADLKLGPLADNGGPTQTIALLPGSIAIDGVTCLASAPTDQRGYPRPATGLDTCDSGAYEAGTIPSIQTTTLSDVSGAGQHGGNATVSARLAVNGTPVVGKTIAFSLNGTGVGVANTGSDGVARLSNASIAGIAVGSYPDAIVASYAGNEFYTASSSSGTLTVSLTTATIELDTWTFDQIYDGTPRVVDVLITTPDDLSYSVTYNGSTTPPTDAGTYTVVATITDPNYTGSTTGTLTVEKADQSITVETLPPYSAIYGTSFTVAATTEFGLPVSYSSSGLCSNVGATFTMTGGWGFCHTIYSQAGNHNVNPANSFEIVVLAMKADQTVSFTSTAPVNAGKGGAYTPTATGGGSGNPITFIANGACSYDSVAGDVLLTALGTCTVMAHQDGNDNYNESEYVTQSFTVGRASLSVTANDVTMPFGGPVPVFTATVAGLINGDTFESLGGTCTATVANGPVTSSTPAGSYPAAITCSDVYALNYNVTYTPGTLTITEAPEITSASVTTFTVGTEGTFTVTVSGYPAATLSTTGPLPSGISLGSDGLLSGTPADGTSGVYSFEVVASNGTQPDATQLFTLTITEASAFTSPAATTFTAGQFGSFTVTAIGNPAPTFSLQGTLPGGVTFSDDGLLSGTPVDGSGGVYQVTIVASNDIGMDAEQAFTLTVNEAPAITSDDVVTFNLNLPGNFTVAASGYPVATFTLSGTLPNGVNLGPDGALGGTPTEGGTFIFTIVAANGVAPEAQQTFTLTVVVPEVFAPDNITVPNDPDQAGASVSYPAPTSIGAVGTITCTPTSGSFFPVGTTTVTCSATIGISDTFTITVLDTQSPSITVPANISVQNIPGQAGAVVTYPDPVAADNLAGVTAACLPPSGTFFAIGSTTVTCTATDAANNVTTAQFTITVAPSTQVLLDQLHEDTFTLVTNPTTERALLTTLDRVQQYVDSGNSFMAYLTTLQYVLQVDQQRRSGLITPAAASQLLTHAQALVRSLL